MNKNMEAILLVRRLPRARLFQIFVLQVLWEDVALTLTPLRVCRLDDMTMRAHLETGVINNTSFLFKIWYRYFRDCRLTITLPPAPWLRTVTPSHWLSFTSSVPGSIKSSDSKSGKNVKLLTILALEMYHPLTWE